VTARKAAEEEPEADRQGSWEATVDSEGAGVATVAWADGTATGALVKPKGAELQGTPSLDGLEAGWGAGGTPKSSSCTRRPQKRTQAPH
jgi:hypothetical protein